MDPFQDGWADGSSFMGEQGAGEVGSSNSTGDPEHTRSNSDIGE